MKRLLAVTVVVVFVVGVYAVFPRIQNRLDRERAVREQATAIVPEPTVLTSPRLPSATVTEGLNYDVPFTTQAPLQNWDPLHEEACEEASALMVMRYFDGAGEFASPEDADRLLTELVHDNAALGYPVDDTAKQVAELIRYKRSTLKTEILDYPTAEDIRARLLSGALVILPAQGQWLGNPFYTAPGPRYHMLVIKGFTADGRFITNDPGTKRGKDYVYDPEVLLRAMHDWNGGDVEHGVPRVIAVSSGTQD